MFNPSNDLNPRHLNSFVIFEISDNPKGARSGEYAGLDKISQPNSLISLISIAV